jgi:hypothetical protein
MAASSIPFLWESALNCEGTPGEAFLRWHGVEDFPLPIVRFLPDFPFRQGRMTAPAILFACRRWPLPDVIGLEVYPIHHGGGRVAADFPERETFGAVADAVTCMVDEEPGLQLALADGGLDALAFASERGLPVWGVSTPGSFGTVALPPPGRLDSVLLVIRGVSLPCGENILSALAAAEDCQRTFRTDRALLSVMCSLRDRGYAIEAIHFRPRFLRGA